MKKIVLTATWLLLITLSCRKEENLRLTTSAPAGANQTDIATAEDKSYVKEYFCGINIGGALFYVYPPYNSVISHMEIAGDDGTEGIRTLIVWYKSSDGSVVKDTVGNKNVANRIYHVAHDFQNGEYIKSIKTYYGPDVTNNKRFLTRIVVTTNKTSFAAGYIDNFRVDVASYFPPTQIKGFWGSLNPDGKSLSQLVCLDYCRTWTKLNGSDGHDIAVANDGTSYMTNSVGKIYRMGVNETSWTQLPGSDAYSIAANANRVCMVNTVGKIYEFINGSWVQLPGSDGVDIAINSNGTLWMVNSARKIYRYNGTSWQLMPGSDAARIAAGNGEVWMVNSVGYVYKWTGSAWLLVSITNALDIAVGSDGIKWTTKTFGAVYRWDDDQAQWLDLCDAGGHTIAANNKRAMSVGTDGKIYRINY